MAAAPGMFAGTTMVDATARGTSATSANVRSARGHRSATCASVAIMRAGRCASSGPVSSASPAVSTMTSASSAARNFAAGSRGCLPIATVLIAPAPAIVDGIASGVAADGAMAVVGASSASSAIVMSRSPVAPRAAASRGTIPVTSRSPSTITRTRPAVRCGHPDGTRGAYALAQSPPYVRARRCASGRCCACATTARRRTAS